MSTQALSYGLPSLFALANAAALIWIKRWVERRDAQSNEAVKAAETRAQEEQRLRIETAESLRKDGELLWGRMREEIRELREDGAQLRERLAAEEKAHELCQQKIRELETRVRELERAT